MRVEAESISSHGAAIVAFEASGLRASSFRNGCNVLFVLFAELRVAYWEPFRNHSRKQKQMAPLRGLHTGNHSGTIPMERQTNASI